MNKAAIRSFAIWARKSLINDISAKIDTKIISSKGLISGVDEEGDLLIEEVNRFGFKKVVEEASYKIFIQLMILRYVEINDYFLEYEKLITMDWINKRKNLRHKKEKDKLETTYKELIVGKLSSLNNRYPLVFCEELGFLRSILPDNLLRKSSIIDQLLGDIVPDDFKDIETLGFLYQFYMSEKHDEIVGMNNGMITKDQIPAATQLFTPKWIVRYMVDNSLGKYIIENYGKLNILEKLKFLIDNSCEIKLKRDYGLHELPLEIKVLDPACGSGHILLYVFDILYDLYLELGYETDEIPRLIIENNLYGFEIDERVTRLAISMILLKAREKNKMFFDNIKNNGNLNIICFEESNYIADEVRSFIQARNKVNEDYLWNQVINLIKVFDNAKEYGALIDAKTVDDSFLANNIDSIENSTLDVNSKNKIITLIKQSVLLNKQYDIVIANPPYISKKYMDIKLKEFIHKNYGEFTGDLFSTFMIRNFKFAKPTGITAFMTPFVWMFIKEYHQLRKLIVEEKTIMSLVQLEYSGYADAAVPICTFVLKNFASRECGDYIRLSKFKGAENQELRVIDSINNPSINYRYKCDSELFKRIPGLPIAYWLPEKVTNIFVTENKLSNYIDITGSQNITANNEKYLRKHWEININDIFKKWQFYIKGGDYRKWYGNIEYVVDWSQEARGFYKANKTSNLLSEKYWFRDGITYNGISVKGFTARKVGKYIYDKGGPTFHLINKELEYYILALLNSKVGNFIMELYNPTLNYQVQDMKNVPLLLPKDKELLQKLTKLSKECEDISREDWDSFETSFDFKTHPLIKYKEQFCNIEDAFSNWNIISQGRFDKLKSNEQEINRILIDLYGLDYELSPELDDKDITVSKANLLREVKSFISYGIGCIMGRYSLDEEGIIFSGGEFNLNRYNKFKPSIEVVIPIFQSKTLKEDLVDKLEMFIEASFGVERLGENLNFIAGVLSNKNSIDFHSVIREYLLNQFYKDHIKNYKKRPIYWMFQTGRNRAYNSLTYVHRINSNSIIPLIYRHLDIIKDNIEKDIGESEKFISIDETNGEGKIYKNNIKKLKKKLKELEDYQILLKKYDNGFELDYNNGVRQNYYKYRELLTKI